ncbi:hypothetical protein IEZ28_05420 [Aerococcaceae bacterium zg-1292]|uniref:hypothetical protein n=1 Tax=Aerococcaceae bacterium zg-1292 TaxID=2774330 RepID=UPI00198D3C1A|nr:hypothetical protein [Aerococcaceae bacterium zg-1292]
MQSDRKLMFGSSLIPTSKLWAAREIMHHSQEGRISLPEVSEENTIIAQGKQLVEEFKKIILIS